MMSHLTGLRLIPSANEVAAELVEQENSCFLRQESYDVERLPGTRVEMKIAGSWPTKEKTKPIGYFKINKLPGMASI